MFSALAAIARDTPLVITITGERGTLHVIIAGKGDKPAAFAQPVRVTGTPEELDAELPAQLAAYAAQMQAPATAIALPAPAVKRPPAARKNAAKQPAAQKRPPRAPKPPKTATPKPVRAPKPAKAEAPRADLPGKPECLADLRTLQAKYGAKLTRRKFIKEAATGRRYEKLWKNFEAFVAEGAQGELPMEPAPAAAPVPEPAVATTHVVLDWRQAWPFPTPNAAAPAVATTEDFVRFPAESSGPAAVAPEKPRVIGPMASARPVTPTEEEPADDPDRNAT